MSLGKVPICEPWAVHAGIHGHPESGSHHWGTEALSHWRSQQMYLPPQIRIITSIREGGEGAKAHYRYEWHLRETAYYHTADKQKM